MRASFEIFWSSRIYQVTEITRKQTVDVKHTTTSITAKFDLVIRNIVQHSLHKICFQQQLTSSLFLLAFPEDQV